MKEQCIQLQPVKSSERVKILHWLNSSQKSSVPQANKFTTKYILGSQIMVSLF